MEFWEDGRGGGGRGKEGSEIRREVIGDGGRGDGEGGGGGGGGFKQIEWQTHKHMTHVVPDREEKITPKFQDTV